MNRENKFKKACLLTGRVSSRAAALALLLALPVVAGEKEGAVAPSESKGLTVDETTLDESFETMKEMDIESLLEMRVVSSTKTVQRSGQAPAIVTVITADEIQARGYGSVAEILRVVPGFYDVYDLVTHNLGIRGINGGARASGAGLKLMIDGHPVDYRPTTGNFMGEELIPLQVIDRIEIVRGPVSALYGANAFLGIVNIITKRGGSKGSLALVGQGNFIRSRPGGGGGLVGDGQADGMEVVLGVNIHRLDRSGLSLPSTSPALSGPNSPAERGSSSADFARPRTFFGKASLGKLDSGQLTLMASVQHLDAVGEFQDFGPLVHGTRVSLVNQNYRLTYDLQPSDTVSVQVSGSYFSAGPTDQDRLDLGRSDYFLLSSVKASGFGLSAEGRIQPGRSFTLVFGADLVNENHLLQTFDQKLIQDIVTSEGAVLRAAGTIIPGEGHGREAMFRNLGAFTQATLVWNDEWSAILGGRVDLHNIYGFNPSLRGGLVYSPGSRPVSLKLLYGSSFKAPSAVQLYTQPMTTLDIQGNPDLRAQTAHTLELAGGMAFGDWGELTLNVFASYVIGRVEFVQRSLFLGARNARDEWLAGGELEARFRPLSPLQVRCLASVARSVLQASESVVTGRPEVINPLFPFYQFHLIGDYRLPWAGLQLSVEPSFIGPRTTSQSNALISGVAYDLPPYFVLGAALSMKRKFFGDRETQLALRISDVFNRRWPEPGFRGIDVPTLGRTILLTVVQPVF